jgi:hypothetical protein
MADTVTGTLSCVAALLKNGNCLLLTLALLVTLPAQADSFDHSIWQALLQTFVHPLREDKASLVDYAGIKQQQDQLTHYLNDLSSVSQTRFNHWTKQDQLAFLINAYNAWTIKLISDNYPDIESIKDLGSWFSTPWDKAFIPLLGDRLSLNDIEHGLIRESGRYHEPRIHFAVNCASIGCPALRNEAYVGNRLDAQLESAAQGFLADNQRNRLNGTTLEVSKIFQWYGDDFKQGWRNAYTLVGFFAHYAAALGLSTQQTKALKSGNLDIKFLDYDWRLNDYRQSP